MTVALRHSLPPGGQIAMRPLRDGWSVRFAIWPARDPALGNILLLTGRGDFIEKYAEAINDLVAAGWGVACFDWRGQGLSGRMGDAPEKGHCTAFDPWLADLGEVIDWCKAAQPERWFAVAHSMGAHLLVRRMAAGQDDFVRAVLLSPMFGMLAPPLGPAAADLAARLMVAIGRGGDYVAGGGARIKAEPGSARQTLLTSDPDRYADEAWWAEQQPGLSMGSATWGWLAAAFRSVALLFTRGALQGVRTPLLIMIPQVDRLVDNAATRRAQALIPGALLEEVACSGHELLREASDTRARVLARLTGFLTEGA